MDEDENKDGGDDAADGDEGDEDDADGEKNGEGKMTLVVLLVKFWGYDGDEYAIYTSDIY